MCECPDQRYEGTREHFGKTTSSQGPVEMTLPSSTPSGSSTGRPIRVQRLFIYPVKSLKPVELETVELTNEGLRFDRSFVLVQPPTDGDPVAKHITIKHEYRASYPLLQIPNNTLLSAR